MENSEEDEEGLKPSIQRYKNHQHISKKQFVKWLILLTISVLLMVYLYNLSQTDQNTSEIQINFTSQD